MITIIHPTNVEEHWPLVAPWIMQAIGDNRHWIDVNVVKENAIRGGAQIWMGTSPSGRLEVVLVTEVGLMSNKPFLILHWLAGEDMKKWYGAIDIIEAYARDHGFSHVEIWGRPGFYKMLKGNGYKLDYWVISKSLEVSIH